MCSSDLAAPVDRARCYAIAPERFLAVDRDARARGLDVVGFFHSHPDHPAVPSRTDLERAWSSYVYVIAPTGSAGTGTLTAHRLRADGTRFDPEPIEPAPGETP